MTDDGLKQLMASNAKAIEALSNALVIERKQQQSEKDERRREQTQLYQYLGRLAPAQSSFYEVQSDYYHQLAELSDRWTRIDEKMAQILERVSSPHQNQGSND